MTIRPAMLALAALPLLCVGAADRPPCDKHPKSLVVDELIARRIVLKAPNSKYSITLEVDGDSARVSVRGTYSRSVDLYMDGNNISVATGREGRVVTGMGMHEASNPVLFVRNRNGLNERTLSAAP